MMFEDFSWCFMIFGFLMMVWWWFDDFSWCVMFFGVFLMMFDVFSWCSMILGWFLMIFHDVWWFVMIFDDAWWFLMIFDDHSVTIGTNSQSIVTESMVSYVSWKKLLTENPRSSNRAWVVHFSAGTCDKDRGVGFLLRNDLDDLLWTWHQRSGTGETGGTGQFRLPVIQHQDVNDKYDN